MYDNFGEYDVNKRKNAPARNAPQPRQSWGKKRKNAPARNAPQPHQSLGKKSNPIIISNNPIQLSYQIHYI